MRWTLTVDLSQVQLTLAQLWVENSLHLRLRVEDSQIHLQAHPLRVRQLGRLVQEQVRVVEDSLHHRQHHLLPVIVCLRLPLQALRIL